MPNLNDLQLSISNLWEDFGTAPPAVATIINTTLAALGVLVFVYTTGWVAWLGLAWALMHAYAIVSWVIQS